MNSGYCGTQQEINPTNINQEFGCLGPHEQIIEVGDDHHMVFQEGGDVQLWINPQDCVVKKFSHFDET